jgi:hypothetical protein
MSQIAKTITIGDGKDALVPQLEDLIRQGYTIVSMVVTSSGGMTVYSQHADIVVVVLEK